MRIFIIFCGLIAGTYAASCNFKCPNSKTPAQNPNFTPVPNGCGPKLTIPLFLLPNSQFVQCCNNHDRCYGSCNSGHSKCDSEFLSCMRSSCTDARCNNAANLLYTAVDRAGCLFYLSGQRQACLCK